MRDQRITIAVDAMGGDHAPEQNVAGALLAARQTDLRIVLVGDPAEIKPFLQESTPGNILMKQAVETVGMHEHPVQAIKKKTDSSLAVGAQLVRDGEADALVSAGNTGACVAAGLLIIGRIRGIDRPAIATLFPNRQGFSLLLDAGANADCKPENILEFAQMGSVYMRRVMGIEEPSVGLLNIGEESSKGNFLALRAHGLLRSSELNFFGNIEGRDLPEGRTDIIVCDGFIGNITLKLMEGISAAIFAEIKTVLKGSLSARMGAAFLYKQLKALKSRFSAESYGGSPLLGVKKPVVIAHGSSTPTAIANAIKMAAKIADQDVVGQIEHRF